MKIYARQVPPEYQESPLFMGDWPENVFVFGNRYFKDHAERLEDIRRGLEDIYDVCQGWSHYSNLADVIPARDDGREYTRAERIKFAVLAEEYAETGTREENAVLCDALELITGLEYEYTEIRGCCQGDWQNIIYPAEYGREWLECFESEYFNTGSEWIIDDTGDAMPDPADIVGWSLYAHAWGADAIRAEIAAAVGVNTDDVILYQFDGWTKTAKYQEVI